MMVECCIIPGHITGLYIFAVLNLCALLNLSLVSADIFVIDVEKNSTIDTIRDKEAMFGPDVPEDGLLGRLVYVVPHNACESVMPPPPEVGLAWIALIERGPCHFDQKVWFAQKAGYAAAIVHNYEGSNSVIPMGGDSSYSTEVKIPAVFVGYTDGMDLAYKYNYTDKSVVIRIDENSDEPPASFFLPFVVVVSICFLGVVAFSIVKCVKYFQHIRRTRLSKSALKKIPTRKYRKGDHYDTCAICLEDYEEGEKLRVLPCNHTYHCKCIDPWLTKRKKTCPQCKRRVIPGRESDSESEGEDGEDNEAAGGGAPSENTPLLGGGGGGNNNTRHPPAAVHHPPPSMASAAVVVAGSSAASSSSRRGGRNREAAAPSSSFPGPPAVVRQPGAGGSLSRSWDTLDEDSVMGSPLQPEVIVIRCQKNSNTTTTTTPHLAGVNDKEGQGEGGGGEEELDGAVGGVDVCGLQNSANNSSGGDQTEVIVEVEPTPRHHHKKKRSRHHQHDRNTTKTKAKTARTPPPPEEEKEEKKLLLDDDADDDEKTSSSVLEHSLTIETEERWSPARAQGSINGAFFAGSAGSRRSSEEEEEEEDAVSGGSSGGNNDDSVGGGNGNGNSGASGGGSGGGSSGGGGGKKKKSRKNNHVV